jgi:hypothetical protein
VAQIVTDSGITSNSVYFRNCWFKSPERYAIWLTQGDDIQVTGCTFDVSAYHSIRLGNATNVVTNMRVTNNTFYGITLRHIEVWNVRGLIVANNNAYAPGGASTTFIDIYSGGPVLARDITVTGNVVKGLYGFAALSTVTHTFTATGNTLVDVDGYLLTLTGGGVLYHLVFTGNTAVSTVAYAAGAAFSGPGCGLQVAVISQNSILAGATTALMFDMSDARVTDNRLTHNQGLRFTANNNFANPGANAA